MSRKTFAVILPARYGSSRFPGKPLAKINGRPLIEWVYRRAETIRGVKELLVATDDDRIAETVRGFNGRVVITTGRHETGTDRVAEVVRSMDVDFVVNLQGDEPIFDPTMIKAMMDRLAESPEIDIVTACHPIYSKEDLHDSNVVKVVMDGEKKALYFSRSPIPSGALDKVGSEADAPPAAFRHVGVYAFTKKALMRFAELPCTTLERSESLEQLRALEHGMKIGLIIAAKPTLGVDVPEDIKKVEKEITRT